MTTETPNMTGLLTLDEVGEQLAFAFPSREIARLLVNRLIARGSLKTVQCGEENTAQQGIKPRLRVRVDDLKELLANAVTLPQSSRETLTPVFPLSDDGRWFTNPWAHKVGKFIGAARQEMASYLELVIQDVRRSAMIAGGALVETPPVKLPLELRQLADAITRQLMARNVSPINQSISISPTMQALIDVKPDATAKEAPMISFLDFAPGLQEAQQDTSFFANLTEIALAATFQQVAKRYIHDRAMVGTIIKPEDAGVLYASPGVYEFIRDGAKDVLLASPLISASMRFAFPLGGPHDEIPIQIYIDNRALMQAARTSEMRLAALAF